MTPTAPTPHLDLSHLTKRFGDFTALRDISLRVEEGEFLCFVGPSGCGKTTLLRLIAGLETVDEGRVVQRGQDVTALPPAGRDFGIVFQSYALFPNLTVARNVAYGLEGKGKCRSEIAARVDEMLELVGLPDQKAKYPSQISGGQQQRVALARALAPEPGLLLLDEPLSALDAKVREHLRHEIRAVQTRLGLTTVMVTHDQDEALQMADRIVVMNAGQIEQVGTPTEIYKRPATRFVADFIGDTNWLTGMCRADGEIEIEGQVLSCQAHGARSGQGVHVGVRPEDVVLADAGNETHAATLEDLRFRGSFAQCHLRLAHSGQTLVAHLPHDVLDQQGVAVGDAMGVAFRPNRAVVFANSLS